MLAQKYRDAARQGLWSSGQGNVQCSRAHAWAQFGKGTGKSQRPAVLLMIPASQPSQLWLKHMLSSIANYMHARSLHKYTPGSRSDLARPALCDTAQAVCQMSRALASMHSAHCMQQHQLGCSAVALQWLVRRQQAQVQQLRMQARLVPGQLAWHVIP